MASDLHIHTSASDGRLAPEAVWEEARDAGLSCIAITDHDTVNGLLTLKQKKLLQDAALRVIPGIEFSADFPGCEVHILGYNIDLSYEPLLAKLRFLVESRWERFERIVERVNAMGYEINQEDVIETAGKHASIGRAHIARTLVEKGYFSRLGEVFDVLLGKGCPGYVSHTRMTPQDILRMIRSAGGKAVLAHPKLIGDDAVVKKIIAAGIDGVEVYHPKHDESAILNYKKIAEENGLFITGGSDYHAIATRYPDRLGSFTISDDLVKPLLSETI